MYSTLPVLTGDEVLHHSVVSDRLKVLVNDDNLFQFVDPPFAPAIPTRLSRPSRRLSVSVSGLMS